ncbi:hypothetical protein [Chitinophaga sp. LS1]|uniref:hypothetical protein n=1 Tax=Chitinophaga sp. LS1 TaxID=3051176 RepID=UPI002AAB749B|nr:hypothetical protein [Chitinophaga sp. LS1]WPV67971.1 hypothetical protein QQL36_04430 [Chitinophaga sp. LS1]
MAEFISGFEEMIEEDKREGKHHVIGYIGKVDLTFEEALAVRLKYFASSVRIGPPPAPPIKCR